MRKFAIIIVLLIVNFATGKLPPTIPICSRNVPNLSDCIINSIKVVQPRLGSGNLGPGLVIPSVEPFFIKQIQYGNERSLKVTMTDLYLRGSSKFHIDKLRTNLKDLKFDFILTFPRLDITSKYKFVLNLLGSPLHSNGDAYVVLENIRCRVTMKARLVNINGIDFMKIDPLVLKIHPGKTRILKLTNLFGGNPVLGEIVNALLVNNSEFLLNDAYPLIERQLSEPFTSLANRITSEASFDELFPY